MLQQNKTLEAKLDALRNKLHEQEAHVKANYSLKLFAPIKKQIAEENDRQAARSRG